MLYKIVCYPMHPLWCSTCAVCATCGSHAVLWSRIGILMRLLAEELLNTAGPLFPTHCPCGTIFLTQYSMVWDWRVSRTESTFCYWTKLLNHFLSSTIFTCLFFLSKGRYCGAGVIGLIWYRSLLPTSFNNKKNDNKII